MSRVAIASRGPLDSAISIDGRPLEGAIRSIQIDLTAGSLPQVHVDLDAIEVALTLDLADLQVDLAGLTDRSVRALRKLASGQKRHPETAEGLRVIADVMTVLLSRSRAIVPDPEETP